VPAPAVIPAPRAYINAVAVKGFVVELWVSMRGPILFPRYRTLPIDTRERQKLRSRDRSRRIREQCTQTSARVHYCD